MSDSLFDRVTDCRPTALLKETPTLLLCILQNISEHFFLKKKTSSGRLLVKPFTWMWDYFFFKAP